MISKTLLPWIFLFFFSSASCDTLLDSPCKVQHLDGTCKRITSCKFAMSLLTINDVIALRSMFCGFEGSTPMVCCPIADKYEKATTRYIRTTTVPSANRVDESKVVTESPPAADLSVLPGRDVCGPVVGGDKIVGGTIAAIDEFPWLARIKFYIPVRRQESYACSGALISDLYVLTAAHCVTTYKTLSVRLGEWDTETTIDCEEGFCSDPPVDLKVVKVIIHPEYDRRNLTKGDIALLKLERPVTFTEFIVPICLPTSDYIANQDYAESTFVTAGWGKTEFGQESTLKRKVSLDAVPYSICTAAIPTLPKLDDPNVICAGGKKGLDSCRGDSGGPLMRIVGENYKQNWYAYGITSYGVLKCGTAGKPGVYTRVSKYMDWIINTLNET